MYEPVGRKSIAQFNNLNFGQNNTSVNTSGGKSLLEQIQEQNAKLKPVDPNRKNRPIIGLDKKEKDDLSEQLQLALAERRKEFENDNDSDDDDDDDDDEDSDEFD